MDNKEYDNEVIKFHSKLLLSMLTKENKDYVDVGENRKLMKVFCNSFNETVAKPLIENKISEMTSINDMSGFPEQFLNYIDVSDFRRELCYKKSKDFKNILQNILHQYDISKGINEINLADMNLKQTIEDIAKFLEDIFVDKINTQKISNKISVSVMVDEKNTRYAHEVIEQLKIPELFNEQIRQEKYFNILETSFSDAILDKITNHKAKEKIKSDFKNLEEQLNSEYRRPRF